MKKGLCVIFILCAFQLFAKERKGDLYGKPIDFLSKEVVEIIINDSVAAIGEIYFSPAGKSFIALLPLTLTVDDYNHSEKLGTIEEKLNITGMVNNHNPQKGDIAFYLPWNSISIYYIDYGITKDLYQIGKVTWGLDNIIKQNTKFIMTIRKQK